MCPDADVDLEGANTSNVSFIYINMNSRSKNQPETDAVPICSSRGTGKFGRGLLPPEQALNVCLLKNVLCEQNY